MPSLVSWKSPEHGRRAPRWLILIWHISFPGRNEARGQIKHMPCCNALTEQSICQSDLLSSRGKYQLALQRNREQEVQERTLAWWKECPSQHSDTGNERQDQGLGLIGTVLNVSARPTNELDMYLPVLNVSARREQVSCCNAKRLCSSQISHTAINRCDWSASSIWFVL
jgi:hypothetical protein